MDEDTAKKLNSKCLSCAKPEKGWSEGEPYYLRLEYIHDGHKSERLALCPDCSVEHADDAAREAFVRAKFITLRAAEGMTIVVERK